MSENASAEGSSAERKQSVTLLFVGLIGALIGASGVNAVSGNVAIALGGFCVAAALVPIMLSSRSSG